MDFGELGYSQNSIVKDAVGILGLRTKCWDDADLRKRGAISCQPLLNLVFVKQK